MAVSAEEREWAAKAQRFLKPELRRAGLTYAGLAQRLKRRRLKPRLGVVVFATEYRKNRP